MNNERIIMMETGSPISSQKENSTFILKKQAKLWLSHILRDSDDTRKLDNWKELFGAMQNHQVSLSVSEWMNILNDGVIGPYAKQEYPNIFDNIIGTLPTTPDGYPMLLNESTFRCQIYVDGEWIEEGQSENDTEKVVAEMYEQIVKSKKHVDDIESELGKDSL